MSIADLPAVNACLNGLAAIFLGIGYVLIRQGKRRAHRNCMIAAFVTSCLFLVSYLTYHSFAGATRFKGEGWIRPVYFTLLISHTILATVIVPLVITTLVRAVKEQYDLHRRIARWTWPLWMYVSVTGVVIYLMLYHIYPSR
jgi:putative membrane protein